MNYVVYVEGRGALSMIEDAPSRMTPGPGEIFIPCEKGADLCDSARWERDVRTMRENGWIAPAVELAREVRREEIAEARWRAETGGVTLNGMTIRTDRESQALITGAALQATVDPEYSCRWKAANGFATLDAGAILAAAAAVRSHVQACFDREAELDAALEAAGTVPEIMAVQW